MVTDARRSPVRRTFLDEGARHKQQVHRACSKNATTTDPGTAGLHLRLPACGTAAGLPGSPTGVPASTFPAVDSERHKCLSHRASKVAVSGSLSHERASDGGRRPHAGATVAAAATSLRRDDP